VVVKLRLSHEEELLRELWVFEDEVLRRVFRRKRENKEADGGNYVGLNEIHGAESGLSFFRSC
jgi:hypothetical protein